MTFSEYMQLLFSVIGAGYNTSAFTKAILDCIVTEGGSDALDTYTPSSFKSFFNGSIRITSLARKINMFLNPYNYEEHLRKFSDEAAEGLCAAFQTYIPEITSSNYAEKLCDLLVSIIREAAQEQKKSTPKGAIKNTGNCNAETVPQAVSMEKLPSENRENNIAPVKPDTFDRYMEGASAFYSDLKTQLFPNRPCAFSDVYVCNDLRIRGGGRGAPDRIISDATVPVLSEQSGFIIISGTGGSGKSMLLRHLFLTAVSDYDRDGILPVLLPLRKYNGSLQSIAEFACQEVCAFDSSIRPEQVNYLLETGRCALLLDGLDEIPSSARSGLEEELETAIKRYPGARYILTSRPSTNFQSFQRFTVLELQLFRKEQALTMIDMLYYPDADAKAEFRRELDETLYRTHTEFTGNPLLLTIMLMTYSVNGNIPRKRSAFYALAYETMARRHDAAKGSFARSTETALAPDEFAKYFAEFCARTYKDEVLEFTEQSFAFYMDRVIASRGGEGNSLTAEKFLSDLTGHLCLMVQEGENYSFIHRSFQEYFCALFFSVQMDDTLGKTARFFGERRGRSCSDRTFDLLYEMIPEKIDRFILLPYLTALWENCDRKQGYWTYLEQVYPVLYSAGTDSALFFETYPIPFFYDFITRKTQLRFTGEIDRMEWPASADHYKNPCGELSESCGASWRILIRDVLEDCRDAALRSYMEAETFPLMREYRAMRSYTEDLRAKYAAKPENQDDWF